MKSTLVRRFGDYGIVVILILLVGYFAAVSPNHLFLSSRNLVNILQQVVVVGVLSVGLTYVIVTGGIDLSVGAVLAVGAVVSASVAKSGLHISGHQILLPAHPLLVPIALLAAMLAGGLCGAWNGFLITRLRAAPFIATLALLAIARGGALKGTEARPISGLPEEFTRLGGGAASMVGGLPIPIWIFGTLFVVAGVVLSRSQFGRHIYAIGGNEEAARLSGVPVDRTKFLVYVLSGTLAALAGALLAARVNAGDPLLGVGFELNAITAVVLGGTSLAGGRGTIAGTILGVLVMGVLDNGLSLSGVQEFDKQVLGGSALLLAILMDRLKATGRAND